MHLNEKVSPDSVTPESCQNTDYLRKLHDELRDDIATRQHMIASDTTKSLDEVNRWFQGNPTEYLTEHWKSILNEIQLARENALIEVQLNTLSKNTQELDDNGIVKQSSVAEIKRQLEEIKTSLNVYEMIQEIDLCADIPKYTLRFGSLSSTSVTQDLLTTRHGLSQSVLSLANTNITTVIPAVSVAQAKQSEQHTENTSLPTSCSVPALSLTGSHDFMSKSLKIDMFATDGGNVFYTSYSEDGPDFIACRNLHNRSDTDLSCIWNQSRISDLVWWNCVSAFVCVAKDGIHTVTTQNGAFTVETRVKGAWSNVRVSTNSHHLWLWAKSDTFHGVLIYGSDFELERTIDVTDSNIKHFVRDSSSFCLTDKLVASAYQDTKAKRQRLQVHLNDFNLINFKTVRLGPFAGDIMIRTDGDNQFYILVSEKTMHVISSEGKKARLDLSSNCNTFAVVRTQCVVVCRERQTLEVLAV